MYAEVLTIIASFETGIAHELKRRSENLGRQLSPAEVEQIFKLFSEHPLHRPYIEDARTKMASRDMHFRDALH